jgi:hypothetical protein
MQGQAGIFQYIGMPQQGLVMVAVVASRRTGLAAATFI